MDALGAFMSQLEEHESTPATRTEKAPEAETRAREELNTSTEEVAPAVATTENLQPAPAVVPEQEKPVTPAGDVTASPASTDTEEEKDEGSDTENTEKDAQGSKSNLKAPAAVGALIALALLAGIFIKPFGGPQSPSELAAQAAAEDSGPAVTSADTTPTPTLITESAATDVELATLWHRDYQTFSGIGLGDGAYHAAHINEMVVGRQAEDSCWAYRIVWDPTANTATLGASAIDETGQACTSAGMTAVWQQLEAESQAATAVSQSEAAEHLNQAAFVAQQWAVKNGTFTGFTHTGVETVKVTEHHDAMVRLSYNSTHGCWSTVVLVDGTAAEPAPC